ncbi:methyl-accepting chemotaxis protein [Aquincola sp. MAHUQ-54]|uniref:Methyl-accepting chemotaxis protein n=1 Tax=Aquincola agrisoli TaxID=3119538 RepID=A0AAW9QNB0_9BURK
MNLQSMKISTRLTLGFAVLAILIVVLGAVALLKVTAINGHFSLAIDDRYPKVKRFQVIKEQNATAARAMRDMFIVTDPAEMQALDEEINRSGKLLAAEFDALKNIMTTPKGKAGFEKLAAARAAYKAPREQVTALIKAGKVDEARATMLKDLRPRHAEYVAAVDELINLGDKLMVDAGKSADAEVANAQWTVAALIGAALAIAGVMGTWLIRSTTRPINEAVRVARSVAAGDLTTQFDASGHSETAQLLAALKEMQTRLADIVGGVRQNAEGVATASAQIASGNNDLSARTENQASALEETAASMEELGSTVRANADNAQQANQLAMAASDVATRGGAAVQQVVQTMKGISESSNRIADIIGTIDGIAFQTNILALNAAVEAARAGEQGRGFAVVASEVRSLAQRSADAAKEIKVLITQSAERVEQGTQQVDQAGATIDEVVRSIRRVTDIVGEISSASREQSSGVAQVGEAVTAMDQATQQNAALVEESAAAAESLKGQARQLVDAVAVFRLASDGHRAMPASPPAHHAAAAHAIAQAAAPKAAPRPAPAAAKRAAPASAAAPKAPARAETAAAGGDQEWTSF